MEMHSQRSLYQVHGISAAPLPRSRQGSMVRLVITRLLAALKRIREAIGYELEARRAITELSDMNDHMLRDLGITRGEIEGVVRQARVKVGTNDMPSFQSETGQTYPALPTINSPDLASEGPAEQQQLRKLRS